MSHKIDIDECQVQAYVEPIFAALIKNNAPLELIKQVYLDTGIDLYFSYLPQDLQEDRAFIKTCMEKNLIWLTSIPKDMRGQDTITKELYLSMLEHNYNFLAFQTYTMDTDIVRAALKNDVSAYIVLEEKFREDEQLMIECLIEQPQLIGYLKAPIKTKLMSDEKLLCRVLQTQPTLFESIDSPLKINSNILKTMLQNIQGYHIVWSYLKLNEDPEVALAALAFGDDKRKHIHPRFITMLSKKGIKTNCHSSLKILLEQKSLHKEMPRDMEKPVVRVKI